jgi:hypothetical protein
LVYVGTGRIDLDQMILPALAIRSLRYRAVENLAARAPQWTERLHAMFKGPANASTPFAHAADSFAARLVDSNILSITTSLPLKQFGSARQGAPTQTFDQAIDE